MWLYKIQHQGHSCIGLPRNKSGWNLNLHRRITSHISRIIQQTTKA